MRHALFLMILFLSLSCTSRSQARRDSINTLSDTLSTPDSIMSADTLRLLFVGDLMQHQGQINAARTATGTYDYSACFEYVKEEIGSVDLAIANLEVTLGGKPYKGYPAIVPDEDYILGEIMVINEADYDSTLEAMDAMEGFLGEGNPENEYHKMIFEVENLESNEIESCYVYFYNKDKDELFDYKAVYLPNGDWKEHMLSNYLV